MARDVAISQQNTTICELDMNWNSEVDASFLLGRDLLGSIDDPDQRDGNVNSQQSGFTGQERSFQFPQ
jgi:hypothetical protein